MSIRYPSNFRQDMDREWRERLPARCTYEGHAPDLQHLRGLILDTARVTDLVYVGERDNIAVLRPDGSHEYPWRGVAIVEYDAQGKIVHGDRYNDPIVYAGKGAMDRADLGALGYTDQWLVDAVRDELGETYTPEKPGPSQLRREFFNRVQRKMHGQ